MSPRWRRVAYRCGAVALAAAVVLAALAGCAGSREGPHTGPVRVVAAENAWGSIATVIGGDRAQVTSIIDNPNADPHEYEPTVANARAVADARILIVNGAGYDAWAARLAEASPDASRTLIDAAALVGARPGDNPHLWYSPEAVRAVDASMEAALASADPSGAAYYARQRAEFEKVTLAPYFETIARIKSKYAGVRIATSESIGNILASSLGLKVVTPGAYTNAIADGGEPSIAAKTAAERQIASGEALLLIYNSQNVAPDVAALLEVARAHGVPVVAVTETIPEGKPFVEWQTAQLRSLESALREATGR